jgi:hypothetical protein
VNTTADALKSHPVVASCAEQRAAASTGYTIAEAINDAEFLRRQPEAILSDSQAKRLIDTLLCALQLHPSYLTAVVRGQDVFPLIEQDRAAPFAIRQWAEVAERHGTPPEKILGAKLRAKRWAESALPSKKWPD